MKLSVYARHVGVSDRAALRWLKSGKLRGRQMETGTLLMTEPIDEPEFQAYPLKVAIDTRVSAAEHQDHLEGQAKRWQDCAAKGEPLAMVVKEIGSGVNETRPKRLKLL